MPAGKPENVKECEDNVKECDQHLQVNQNVDNVRNAKTRKRTSISFDNFIPIVYLCNKIYDYIIIIFHIVDIILVPGIWG